MFMFVVYKLSKIKKDNFFLSFLFNIFLNILSIYHFVKLLLQNKKTQVLLINCKLLRIFFRSEQSESNSNIILSLSSQQEM